MGDSLRKNHVVEHVTALREKCSTLTERLDGIEQSTKDATVQQAADLDCIKSSHKESIENMQVLYQGLAVKTTKDATSLMEEISAANTKFDKLNRQLQSQVSVCEASCTLIAGVQAGQDI